MNFLNNVPVASSAIESMVDSAVETVSNQGWGEMISEMINNADPMRFVDSLPYMGVGMLGIFLVMGILIVGTGVLNKVTNLKKKD
jgi:hypothetical protein